MSVPVESVQLEQARQDNLSPDIVASLSHSPFLSVRKTLLSHYDYAWLVPTAVADELINNEDPELRERITGADLTAQQAVMLSKDKSLKVREALARTLTELKLPNCQQPCVQRILNVSQNKCIWIIKKIKIS